MDQSELNRLCNQPDAEGALWRLVRDWDPDNVHRWANREKRTRNITPIQMIGAVAEVCSGAAFIVASHLDGERHEAILGGNGLIERMRASAAHKLTQIGGAHRIILPNGQVRHVPKNGG
jgi:hypothetical protein